MNKRILIVVGILVLAVLGYFGYLQMNKTKTAPAEESVPQSQSSQTVNKGSLKSLLTAGKNVNCEITYPEGQGKGNIYVSGNKMRGDFSSTANNKAMTYHMIQDGMYSYMWGDESNQGTKFKIEADKPLPSAPAGTQTADLDKEVDMNCSNWSTDESRFSPPGNIKFIDMSEMMKNPGGSGPMPKLDASICNQIEDAAAKASCLESLGN